MANSDRTKPYVEAIIAMARGEDALDAVEDELLRIARALEEHTDLHEALADSQLPLGRRLEVVDEVLEAAHPMTRTAVTLLVASGRVRNFDSVARGVAERAAEERERELAHVYVAVPLDQERRERLREALEEVTGKQLEMKVFVDESVIGGVRAQIGDTIIDGTIARRLEEIRARLGS
ncbi:MAG: ATP synthase F1 subunit delta [Actinomycetota bacterium]|nr:ATP synthase F1 subunit delta [Actinomycetota bacterium]